MSSRKPGYLIGVILLALLMSAPQFLVVFREAVQFYRSRQVSQVQILGLGQPMWFGHPLSNRLFWHDKFTVIDRTWADSRHADEWVIRQTDPETGTDTETTFTTGSAYSYLEPMQFGERLWFIQGDQSFEVVDQQLQASSFVPPAPRWGEQRQFLLDGEPAHCVPSQHAITISVFRQGAWHPIGEIDLPFHRADAWLMDGRRIYSDGFSRSAWIAFHNQGEQVHVFLSVGDSVFHREGLELKPVSAPPPVPSGRDVADSDPVHEPVSALTVVNTPGRLAGWTRVPYQPRVAQSRLSGPYVEGHFAIVEGQPAALMVDRHSDIDPTADIFRFDGTQWSPLATCRLPIGSYQFRTVICRDGRKSFLVAVASLGTATVFAIDGAGIRATQGAGRGLTEFQRLVLVEALVPIGTLALGALLAVGTALLMWGFTTPQYGFGKQTVKLASLGRRGLARVIDLALIVFTTAGLGWLMTFGLDRLSLAEALNLRSVHPTRLVAARVVSILALWLAVFVLSLLVAQARWGLTPGKWLCGLRTLRTTLKPCGFARSLVREVVMCVDAGNFLCWTPGILSIACTDCRQRLGDLVADTIVVESASLKSGP